MPASLYLKPLALLLALAALLALIPAAASAAEPPDPLARGPFAVDRLDPLKAGLATLQEPNAGGGAASGASSTITLQIRGVLYMPHEKPGESPLIVIVHGNHGSCDKGTAPDCEVFKRNDEGYAYLGENLASWGYTVVSLDQDQLISRQDNSMGKGMHSRRLLIMAMLDALHKANEEALPDDANYNLGGLLVGKIDFTRIGLMGHSRGGDAVSSFIEYDRMRPTGRRYPLRGVISLAPVDYERHAPYGVPYMTIFGTCDGDVSNLQGARLYERSQYVAGDPYPRIQSAQIGANHNYYNTVWFADADDATGADHACKMGEPNGIRLSGQAGPGAAESYAKGGTDELPVTAAKLDPTINTRISGDPARMGDQEKFGLATMSAFFRRYVGGEGAFEPYLTGELAAEGKPEVPQSACPTSAEGMHIPCLDRIATSYTAPPDERLDVIRPDTEHPLGMSALGTKLHASGFSNPYLRGGGVNPVPSTTASGLDWCDPDPKQTEPGQLGESGFPVTAKPCPNPFPTALGGQEGTREQSPVNGSYGRQLSIAWEKPAKLSTEIPAADQDVSGYRALSMAASVNFFDPRNPARGEEGEWNPEAAPQDFTIAVTDAAGKEATVSAADPRYGTALLQTLGSSTARVHVILKDIRVPLEDFSKQGIDLNRLRKLELRFGDAGMPQKGSIQLADVRFQEAPDGSDVLLDSTAPDAGPGEGPPSSGPDPEAELEEFPRADGTIELPDVTTTAGSNVWTVDDDGAECPNAEFGRIQDAVEHANPWDTVVVCPGVYEESSTPVPGTANPVQTGASNGLTIKKPLKIIGAGADKVTIKPAPSAGTTLAGTEPNLRDGGGNVVTISRQSLGSGEFDENFVDISGVTIESPSTYAEAGVAFFNTSGRISDSVIGPLKRATNANQLTARPDGWGVVATNSSIGAGPGTVERQVTVSDSLLSGYQTGGILFDDASGKDGAPTTKVPSGIRVRGFVEGTVVQGSGAGTVFPQTGIQYHAGAGGFIEDSKVTGNLFTTEQRKSVGVLLTGAETVGWSAKGSLLSGNGYALFNADVANAAVREAAPALATGNFWGSGGVPILGQSVIGATDEEGISGNDGAANPSVLFDPVAGSEPTIPTVPGAVEDLPPTGSIVNPGEGESVAAGQATEPVIVADDDFGVSSVSLTADGAPVERLSESPYAFSWTPSAAQAGKSVALEATVTDSAGKTTTSAIDVPVEAAAVVPPQEADKPTPPLSPPSTSLKIGKLAIDRSRGTARAVITVPAAGTLMVSGRRIKKVTKAVAAGGDLTVAIEARGQAVKALNKKGKVSVKVTIAFAPTGGATVTQTRTVILRKE
jgi:large repetitive protein